MRHKFGFHVNRTGEDVFDAIKRIKPKTIKALDHDVGFWMRVRSTHPDVFLIGRLFVPQQEQAQFINRPADRGRAFAERILRLEANNTLFEGRPLFDAWESYNEALTETESPATKRAYDEFQVAFAQPLLAAGVAPVAMNFATGNMIGQDFLSCFPGTLDTYTYLGFHEYDWPDLWRLHEENIREKHEGGMWLALRYRRIMQEVRQVYGDKHKAIITECGVTRGVTGGPDVGPWNPDEPLAEERYWRSLMWYNSELLQDAYVAHALLFVVGAVTPWESFEHLGGIINRLEAYQLAENLEPDLPEFGDDDQNGVHPAPSTLEEALLAEAAKAQVIEFNPNAALQKRIFADDFVPNSPEFDLDYAGASYTAQRAEHLGTGEVRIYFVKKNDWNNVAYTTRDGITGRKVVKRPPKRYIRKMARRNGYLQRV